MSEATTRTEHVPGPRSRRKAPACAGLVTKRKTTEDDLWNLIAWLILREAGRSDAKRELFRQLPPELQGEIHARAAAERERRAAGVILC